MKKVFLTALIAIIGWGSVNAQMPKEVIAVMQKSDSVLNSYDAISMEMVGKAKMLIVTMNIHIKYYSKGDKSLTQLQSSTLGVEIKSESGCDGTTSWKYTSVGSKPDTLFISKIPTKAKSDYNFDMDIYEEYGKATMKLQKGVYEITFTQPKAKDTPNKTIYTIDARTYLPRSMQTQENGATVKLEFQNITYTVDDNIFIFDRQKFSKCVVVEE